MNDKKDLSEGFDWDVVQEYIDKAMREGRTEDDGWWDYFETLGITRPEEDEAFLQKFREEDRKSTERILSYLAEIKKLARAAQKKYAGV
jgi:hypothetical protein